MFLRRWLPAALAVAGLLAGCGGGSHKAQGASTAAAGAQAASGPPVSASIAGPRTAMPAEKVGILNVNASDPGAALLQSAAAQAAGRLGWSTVSIDAGGNPAKMATGMQQLVTEHVGAVMLDAVDPAAVAVGVRQAHDNGIPVVVYGGAGTASPYVTQVVPNDFVLASLASDYLINSLDGRGKVAIMTTDGISWSHNRSALFEQIARQYPQIHVVAVHQVDFANFTSDLLSSTKAILQANPDLNAILATISPYPTPIAAALEQLGDAGKVKVVGFYDYPSELKLIKAGQLSGVATASFPYNAYEAVDALAQYFGKHVPLSAAEQYVLPLQYGLITRANAPASISDDPSGDGAIAFYTRRWRSEFTNAR